MSKISNLFKGGSKHKSKGNPSAQEAIHKLRETEEMLTKKQDYLEKKIEQEIAIAKKHGTKNKRGIYICFYDGLKKCVHLFLHRGQDTLRLQEVLSCTLLYFNLLSGQISKQRR